MRVLQGDCLQVLPTLPDNSIDLVLTDPPYFKVKGDAWDRQWDKPDQFLAWLDSVVEQLARVLKPNGSLYLFASPQMAARVEITTGRHLNILNHIVWHKPNGRHKACCKEDLRGFFPQTERIIFAEHYGADNIAKGEAGYAAKCDELRGFIFEPLRAYLENERKRAGLTREDVREFFAEKLGTKGKISGHYYDRAQWMLPTPEHYEWLRDCHNRSGGEYLRKDYEYLRKDYEELRRPFSVSADVPYTDVWTFPTVQAYPGKHPCEKPQALLRHIITASSRPGAVVLDAFAGSGSTGIACKATGRDFIGIELCEKYAASAQAKIDAAEAQADLWEAA